MPLFNRMVEIGRVCLVNRGPDAGKLCVIIDVIDANRALVDGPSSVTGVKRQSYSFKLLSLTDIKIKIPRSPRLKTLKKAFEKEEVIKAWESSSWAKRLERQKKKAEMNDFERFKLVLARKKRSSLVSNEFNKLKKQYNKEKQQQQA